MNNRLTHSRLSQRGFSLTEMVLALAIAGLIFAGVWAAASTLNQKARVNKTIEQIKQITYSIRSLYSSTGKFSATGKDMTNFMMHAGIFPADMVQDGTPKSVWGGDVTVMSSEGTAIFDIRIKSPLPADACREIVGRMGGPARDSNIEVIQTDSKTYSTEAQLDALSPISAPSCSEIGLIYNLR